MALSASMRVLIPLKQLYKEVFEKLSLPIKEETFIATVWEDNQAALALATATNPPQIVPRAKHIAVIYHWFRSHLNKLLTVRYIASKEQLADILTKPLAKQKFEDAQKQLMGW